MSTPLSNWAAGTPGRDSTSRHEDPANNPRQGDAPPAVARPRGLGIEADGQFQLFAAIERQEVDRVCIELGRMGGATKKAILLPKSKLTKFSFRTPLMAAAACGDISIFTAVLDACRSIFAASNTLEVEIGDGSRMTMKDQMEMEDMDGLNILMHATRSGNVAIFQAVSKQICPSQVRRLLSKQDAQGMTFLMHAASAGGCTSGVRTVPTPTATPFNTPGRRSQRVATTPSTRWNGTQASVESFYSEEDGSVRAEHEEVCVERWVPMVKTAVAFAKYKLWMPEYRALLQCRDMWQKSIVEHSVASGEVQLFEAVFTIVRNDVFDKEVDMMMETGEDMESEVAEGTAMGTALKSSGEKVASAFNKKTKGLKRDVSLRTEASTVVSKIQSFIPGNLIVIFQLLLPEFSSSSRNPLIVLIVLCAIAPFWAWGANMVVHRDPERKHATARRTAARYCLSVPAMFFWGVGTSTIGETSLGWGDTTSAAALAVATIVIPALDSFFAGSGARRCWGRVVIAWLDVCEKMGKNTSRSCKIPGCCSCARPKHGTNTRSTKTTASSLDSPL